MSDWISRFAEAPGTGAGGPWLALGDSPAGCVDDLDNVVGWDVWLGARGATGGDPRVVADVAWAAPWAGDVPSGMSQFSDVDAAKPGVIHVPFPVVKVRFRDAAAIGNPIPYFLTARPCWTPRPGTTLYGRSPAQTIDGGGSIRVDAPLGATDFRIQGRSIVNTAQVTVRSNLTRRATFEIDKAAPVGGGGLLVSNQWIPLWSEFVPTKTNVLIEGTPGDSFDVYWRFPWGLR